MPQSCRVLAGFRRDSGSMMIRLDTSTTKDGFGPAKVRTLAHVRATVLMVELIATVALAVSTLAVAAVVAHAC